MSLNYEFMGSPQKAKKNFLDQFGFLNFFWSLFSRGGGGNYLLQFGYIFFIFLSFCWFLVLSFFFERVFVRHFSVSENLGCPFWRAVFCAPFLTRRFSCAIFSVVRFAHRFPYAIFGRWCASHHFSRAKIFFCPKFLPRIML